MPNSRTSTRKPSATHHRALLGLLLLVGLGAIFTVGNQMVLRYSQSVAINQRLAYQLSQVTALELLMRSKSGGVPAQQVLGLGQALVASAGDSTTESHYLQLEHALRRLNRSVVGNNTQDQPAALEHLSVQLYDLERWLRSEQALAFGEQSRLNQSFPYSFLLMISLAVLATLAAAIVVFWARRHYSQYLEHQVDELTLATDQARRSAATKHRFLTRLGHKIRTPLTAVVGYADLICDPATTPEKRRAHATVVRRSSDHLGSIMDDVLDLIRMEAGEFGVNIEPCCPSEIVQAAVDEYLEAARAKDLSLTLKASTAIPSEVQTDGARVEQILKRLLENAVAYTHVGEIEVSYRITETKPPRLEISVADTGIGMTPHQIEHAFDPFSAEESASLDSIGRGLSLPVAYATAERLGGDISVVSKSAEGSTFTLTIDPGPLDGVPTLTKEETDRIHHREDQLSLREEVLVAEDCPDTQRLISFLLKRAGASVTLVGNGRQAYEEVQRATASGDDYGVVLMDMEMPEMNGFAATQRLRDDGYDGTIIALTAHTGAEHRERCYEVGCDGYIPKPMHADSLLRQIHRVREAELA